MNKRELTARVQRHMGAGASRNAAQAAVSAVLDSILQAAASDGNVHIAHLGSFCYQSHRMRNGKGLPVPAVQQLRLTRRLHFRPARRLQNCVATCHSQTGCPASSTTTTPSVS